jgi:hypothetical protein
LASSNIERRRTSTSSTVAILEVLVSVTLFLAGYGVGGAGVQLGMFLEPIGVNAGEALFALGPIGLVTAWGLWRRYAWSRVAFWAFTVIVVFAMIFDINPYGGLTNYVWAVGT